MQPLRYRLAILAAAWLPITAFGHDGAGSHGFIAGVTHPLTGIDHLLAMFAVGMLASRASTGRWALPTTFIAAMLAGFGIAALGVSLPFVEMFIAASLLALGAVVLLDRPLPPTIVGAAVALFAVFHGHAHGTEMADASLMRSGLGIVLATAALHAAGLVLTLRIRSCSEHGRALIRASGAAIAAVGVALFSGLA